MITGGSVTPFTLASFMTKSFRRSCGFAGWAVLAVVGVGRVDGGLLHVRPPSRQRSAQSPPSARRGPRPSPLTQPVCLRAPDTYSGSCGFAHWRLQALREFVLVAVRGDGQAVGRADVDAGVALDAELRVEHRLHVAVETCCTSAAVSLGAEPKSTSIEIFLKRSSGSRAEPPALDQVVVVLVRPLMQAILRLDRFIVGGSRLGDRRAANSAAWIEIAAWWPCSTAQMMFLRAERGVAMAKNTSGRVDWNVTLSRRPARATCRTRCRGRLDPRERVFLADHPGSRRRPG